MKKYSNWGSADFPTSLVFPASISAIDRALSYDKFRWLLDKEARHRPMADMKTAKLRHWQNAIENNEEIPPVELTLDAGIGEHFGLMDGRHRIYALHDAGYTEVMAHILPNCESDKDHIRKIAELVRP